MSSDGTRRDRAVAALDITGLVATGVSVLMMLAFLLGSLLLTGGQLTAEQGPNYDSVLPWPLFPVPVWMAVALAAVAALAFVPMAAFVRVAEAPRIMRAIRLTLAGSVGAPFLWMLVFPTSIGADTWPEPTPTVAGAHWIAMVIGAATVALMLIFGWRKVRHHDRARRA